MRMVDIIAKKRDGGRLSAAELDFVVRGTVDGSIPDYQLSALLMAIVWRSMEEEEAAQLAELMARSGDTVDLSGISGVTVDKHSTGGVGDKTTPVVAAIAAACGLKVAKMSGRGLGFTGGTVDKLESIPGYRTELAREEFLQTVREHGLSLIGQSGELAPADKRLYALRDVTATVESLPLIAASIMSKKLAAGAQCILLDVKCGSGAFMKTPEDAAALAQAMCRIGAHNGRKVAALITGMQRPLGYAVGNALEIIEVLGVLRGGGPQDLRELCLALAAGMLELGGCGDAAACRSMAEEALDSGAAFKRFCCMAQAQGGDVAYLQDPQRFEKAACSFVLTAPQDGFITAMDAAAVGNASVLLGAGRAVKGDVIDHAAGIILHRRTGEAVEKGEPVATLYAAREALFPAAAALLEQSIRYGAQPPQEHKLILARVTAGEIEWCK